MQSIFRSNATKKISLLLAVLIIILSIATTSINASAWDASSIIFVDTVVNVTKGWEANSVFTESTTRKYFTLSGIGGTGSSTQIQCYANYANFSSLLSASQKVAIDIYPTFANKNGADKAYFKYSFDSKNFSGDFENPLTSGTKSTIVINSSTIASSTKGVQIQVQNFGNPLLNDASFIISAPYSYEKTTTETDVPTTTNSNPSVTSAPTNPTTSSGGFNPADIQFQNTVVNITKGWESNSIFTESSSKKYFTLSGIGGTGTSVQIQCYANLANFASLLSNSEKIAFDVYPTFSNKTGSEKAYFKYSFNSVDFSGDYSHPLTSGVKSTIIINTSTIASTAKGVQFQIQNYGNPLVNNASFIISAPYAYGQVITNPTSTNPTSTNPTSTTGSNLEDFPPLVLSGPYIRINNATSSVGSTVEVPIVIGNNPGLWSVKLDIKYDETKLKFNTINVGNVFKSSEIYYNADNSNLLKVGFDSENLNENNIKNGTLATIVFTVSSSAPLGSTPVTFANYDADNYIDCNAKNVSLTFGNGTVNITKLASPTTPSIKALTLKTKTSATLRWSKASNATKYEIYQSKGNNSYKLIKSTSGLSLTISKLAAGTKYSYKVKAFNKTKAGNFSKVKSIVTMNYRSKVKFKLKAGNDSFKVIRKNSIVGAKGYQVQYSLSQKFRSQKKYKTKSTEINSSKKISKLLSGKIYYVRVRAYNIVNGKKTYSTFSASSKIKTK